MGGPGERLLPHRKNRSVVSPADHKNDKKGQRSEKLYLEAV